MRNGPAGGEAAGTALLMRQVELLAPEQPSRT